MVGRCSERRADSFPYLGHITVRELVWSMSMHLGSGRRVRILYPQPGEGLPGASYGILGN